MFVLKTSFPPLCTKYIDLNALASVRQVLRDRLQCEMRKTRYIAAHIKFKALMFAYRTTPGSAPLYLNSVLQTYVPREACILQVNNAFIVHPKETQNHFHRHLHELFPPGDLHNSIQTQSSAIFKNLFHLYLTL